MGFRSWLSGLFRRKLGAEAAAVPLHELKRRLRLVVIDDDPSAFPTASFSAEGYNVTYWDRVESLDKLERGEFDIVVLDIGGVAPHLSTAGQTDGLSVLARIKATNPGQVVVAFSGQTFSPSKQRFFSEADDVLDKPTDFLRCKEVIDHLMATRFTHDELVRGFRAMLRQSGVSDLATAKVIRQLDDAIRRGERPDVMGLLTGIVDRADTAERAKVWVMRIAAALGMSA